MNINKNLIILGVALTAVLVVENMALNYIAFTFIWPTKSWILSLVSVGTGILIGYGLHGILGAKTKDNDESYDF